MLTYLPTAIAAALGLCAFALGHTFGLATLGAGVALGCFCIIGFWSHVTTPTLELEPSSEAPAQEATTTRPQPRHASNPVDRLVDEGRMALVLRPNFVGELDDEQRLAVQKEFRRQMTFVHAGRVIVDSWTRVAEKDERGQSLTEYVESFWIDRTPITNAQYAAFVAADGYQPDSPWWPEEARPLINQFVDQTGNPGPLDWHSGSASHAVCNFPVAGISWYEAAAFAAWAGKRLPTDPEWLKAATWPIDTSGVITQRSYPWGEQLHSRHARLWNESGDTVADVSQFSDGANPCGVRHLIGNVWEWMHSSFGDWDDKLPFPADSTIASIRGGAFDTYFQSQATSQFFSAEAKASRHPNIGFRCVVPANDVDVANNVGGEDVDRGDRQRLDSDQPDPPLA